MRVAIIGGTGFIGREVVNKLLQNGLDVGVFSRNKNGHKPNHYQTDYSCEALCNQLKRFDSVIHLAAVRGTNGKLADFHINETILENLLVACVKNNIKNVCFASSISVYSETDKIPWDEETVPYPKTFYGISKLACEYLGYLYSRKYGISFKALRIGQVLGEGEVKGYMMNTFIDNAFSKKTLNVKGKSIAKREFVYVKDVAEAFYKALMNTKVSGAFNIGSGVAYTNLEIAKIINNVFDNVGNIKYNDDFDEGIESSLMSIKKAEAVLGFSPKYTLYEALIDIKKIKLLSEVVF